MRIKLMPKIGTAVCLLVACVSGCGNQYDVDLVLVTGTVTLDGEPMQTGKVEFRPSESDKNKMAPRGAMGFTNELGNYELFFLNAKGCPVGNFKVVISYSTEGAGRLKLDSESKEQLAVEVTPDSNAVFDFNLNSLKKRR